MTLRELYDWYFSLPTSHDKRSSLNIFRKINFYIKNIGEDRRIERLTTQQILKYRLKRLKTAKPSTVNSEISHTREMVSQAFLYGLIKNNPFKDVKSLPCNNAREVDLRSEDLQGLIACSPDPLSKLIFLATKLPTRKMELAGLKKSEVHLDLGETGVIRLSGDRVKSGIARAFPINPKAKKMIKSLIKESQNEHVFEDRYSMRENVIDYNFRKAKKKAGLDHIVFHDLRHVCATELFLAGNPQHLIMKWFGHRSDAMFRRYNHLREEDLYNAKW